jgi:CDP-diacylglycerol--serine O-phosphatidyltransferase
MANPTRRPGKAWAPNALTSANLLLGFFSILLSLRAARLGYGADSMDYQVACWLILWATIFDVLDGKVAKLLHASSEFGLRLDTFADAVTFGLAPAVLVYAAFLRNSGLGAGAVLAAGGYFMAAAFRLARYNVQTAGGARFGFVGVPTPTAAIITTTLYLSTRLAPLPAETVAGLLGLLALAMVSPLRYPGFKGLKGRETVVVLLILLGALVLSIPYGTPRVVFVLFSSFALFWGWCWIPLRPYWVPGVAKED